MDTTLLTVFREVAHLGSFTAAAEALGYTQSAVSRQISSLESQAGAVLFDRLPRGVRLTEEGRCLLPHAEAMLDRLDTARRDLTDLRELAAGRLRVGAFATAEATLVPQAMAAFKAAHPKVSLSLFSGLTPVLVARLETGDLDVAVVNGPQESDRIDLRHLTDDRMFVAFSTAHPLAGRRTVRLAELADEDWIAGSARPEATLLGAPRTPGFRPRITLVVADWTAKHGLVAAGLGITLVPSLAVGAIRPDIALVPLHPDDTPVRRVYAATSREFTRPPAVTAFLGHLESAIAEQTPLRMDTSSDRALSSEEL